MAVVQLTSRNKEMDAAAKIGGNPVSKHQIQPECGTQDGATAESVARDQILKRKQHGQRNTHFPCSADHEQDWQPYPVDPYFCYNICDDHV